MKYFEINVNLSLFGLISYLTLFFIILATLISVAYYTLMERKVLAAMQRRRGPNAVGFYGVFQPLADGLKLIAKEGILPTLAIIRLYVLAPGIGMTMSFCGWLALPVTNFNIITMNSDLDLLIFFCLTSLGSYGVVLAGWGSSSRYAVMGGLRAIAQLISYEVIFLLTILPSAMFVGSFNFNAFSSLQGENTWLIIPHCVSATIFFILMLAETNRTPFDLPEAEAELVSGFNVEYSSALFAMFSLAEYNSMLMMSALFTIVFLGGWCDGYLWFIVKTALMAFLIVKARAGFPRYRFDQLMYLCWYIFLPICLSYLIFQAGMCTTLNIGYFGNQDAFLEIQKRNDAWYIKTFGMTCREE